MKAMDFLMWSADGGPRAEYVGIVTETLQERLDLTTSDAQGIVEVQGRIVVNCFNRGDIAPEDCALMVDMNATVPDIS